MKNSKKLRLWVLSHGRVPGSRMAHKAYRWIDTAGRPTTPPPDPFDIMEQRAKGGYKVLSEADERKVCALPRALTKLINKLQPYTTTLG